SRCRWTRPWTTRSATRAPLDAAAAPAWRPKGVCGTRFRIAPRCRLSGARGRSPAADDGHRPRVGQAGAVGDETILTRPGEGARSPAVLPPDPAALAVRGGGAGCARPRRRRRPTSVRPTDRRAGVGDGSRRLDRVRAAAPRSAAPWRTSRASADRASSRAQGGPTMETVLGAFETRRMAERAIDDLLAAGFSPDQLSALGRHGEAMELTPEHETVEKTATGASIGAAVGGFGSIAIG